MIELDDTRQAKLAASASLETRSSDAKVLNHSKSLNASLLSNKALAVDAVASNDELAGNDISNTTVDVEPKLTRKQRKALTRQGIIDSALTLLVEEGPQFYSMNKITQRAGISQPAFYKHFDTLDALNPIVAELYLQTRAMVWFSVNSWEVVKIKPKDMYSYLHKINFRDLQALLAKGVEGIRLHQEIEAHYSPISQFLNVQKLAQRDSLLKELLTINYIPNERAYIDAFNMALDARDVLLPELARSSATGNYKATDQAIDLLTNLVSMPLQQLAEKFQSRTTA